jgi:hypothetical protein
LPDGATLAAGALGPAVAGAAVGAGGEDDAGAEPEQPARRRLTSRRTPEPDLANLCITRLQGRSLKVLPDLTD